METLSHLDDETDRAAPRRAGDSVAQLHLVAGWNVFGTGKCDLTPVFVPLSKLVQVVIVEEIVLQ